MADGTFWLAVAVGGGIGTAALASASGLFNKSEKPKTYSPIKQAVPPRHFAYGRGRKPGASVLYESVSAYTLDVLAYCHGRIEGNWQHWLNDDPVTLNGDGTTQGIDGRYGNTIVIKTRQGLNTETAYDHVVAVADGAWTSAHRGDFTASVGMTTKTVAEDKMRRIYPNGEVQHSAAADWLCVYDWRDPAQDREDPSTWLWSENPIVCGVHDEWATNYPMWTHPSLGVREKAIADRIWNRRFAPVLDILTEEADACDEAVDLAAGGTIPRYTAFVWYPADTDRKTVRDMFKRSCDGWRTERGDGALILRCGRWLVSPVPITDRMIVDVDGLSAGIPKSRLTNDLQLRFRSPDHNYEMVDTVGWTDEASITKRGRKSNTLDLEEVTNNSQARRVGKSAFYAANEPYSGMLVLDLDEAPAELFEYRFHPLQISEGPSAFNDMFIEVLQSEQDLMERTVTLSIRSASEARYEWDAETEEGDNPGVVVRPSPGEMMTPTVSAVTTFFDDTGSGTGVRLEITGEGPDRDDLTWFARWRVDGDVSWVEAQYTDAADGSPVLLTTGFVPADTDLEVQIAYMIGAGTLSDWSATEAVETATPTTPPSGFTAVLNGFNVDTAFSITEDHGRVYRGATLATVFGSATDVSGELPGTPGVPVAWSDTARPAGGYRYWAVAEDAADDPSTPAGPIDIVVPYEPGTNLITQPEAFNNAYWGVIGGTAAAPVVTANLVAAPDGTTTADRIVFPAVTTAGHFSVVYTATPISLSAIPYKNGLWLRGALGGEEIYIMVTPNGSTFYRLRVTLTTGWQRFSLPFTPTATTHYVQIGTDRRDASQTATAAATVYAWGAQLVA